jgi:hypothetical protein
MTPERVADDANPRATHDIIAGVQQSPDHRSRTQYTKELPGGDAGRHGEHAVAIAHRYWPGAIVLRTGNDLEHARLRRVRAKISDGERHERLVPNELLLPENDDAPLIANRKWRE